MHGTVGREQLDKFSETSVGVAANAGWVGCEALLLMGGAVLRRGIEP